MQDLLKRVENEREMKIKTIIIFSIIVVILPGIFVFKKSHTRSLLSASFISTVNTMTMENGSGSYTLIKQGRDWFLDEGATHFICRNGTVNAYLQKLAGLKIIETAGTSKAVWGDLGVADNDHHSTTLKNGKETVKLFWGKKSAGGEEVFVRKNREESVYVTTFPGAAIYADKWGWVNVKILPVAIDTTEIISLDFKKEGQDYSIIRKNYWELHSARGTARMDTRKMNLLLERIKNLKGEAVVLKTKKAEMMSAGTLIVHLAGDTALILNFLKDKKGSYFAAEESSGYLYRINTAERNGVLPDVKYLLDHF